LAFVIRSDTCRTLVQFSSRSDSRATAAPRCDETSQVAFSKPGHPPVSQRPIPHYKRSARLSYFAPYSRSLQFQPPALHHLHRRLPPHTTCQTCPRPRLPGRQCRPTLAQPMLPSRSFPLAGSLNGTTRELSSGRTRLKALLPHHARRVPRHRTRSDSPQFEKVLLCVNTPPLLSSIAIKQWPGPHSCADTAQMCRSAPVCRNGTSQLAKPLSEARTTARPRRTPTHTTGPMAPQAQMLATVQEAWTVRPAIALVA
jgi:hypothetical protein